MFYVFSYTPDGTETEDAPHIIDMHLTAGVIHQVDFLFQEGAAHEEFIKIMHGNNQLWPTNRDEKIRGDATIISFRDYIEVNPGGDRLQAHIWTTLTLGWVEVIIQIGILPKDILQPLSFDALMQAIAGSPR